MPAISLKAVSWLIVYVSLFSVLIMYSIFLFLSVLSVFYPNSLGVVLAGFAGFDSTILGVTFVTSACSGLVVSGTG